MVNPETSDGEDGPEIVEGDGEVGDVREAAARRRRTEARRAKRLASRICGWCEVSIEYCQIMMIMWYSRNRSDRRLRALPIAICEWCFELLISDEDTPDRRRGKLEAGAVAVVAQEEGPLTKRQRRTKVQRADRSSKRICGWCWAPADR